MQKQNTHQGCITCPVCHGKGKLAEDPRDYDFVTRDPQTSICLICSGSGYVGVRKLLPDGRRAIDVPVDQRPAEASPEPLQPEPALSLGQTTQVKKQAAEEPSVADFPFELRRRGINDAIPLAPYRERLTAAAPESPIEEVPHQTRVLEIDFRDVQFPSIFSQIRAHRIADNCWSIAREEDYIGGLLAHIDYLQNLLKEC